MTLQENINCSLQHAQAMVFKCPNSVLSHAAIAIQIGGSIGHGKLFAYKSDSKPSYSKTFHTLVYYQCYVTCTIPEDETKINIKRVTYSIMLTVNATSSLIKRT